MDAQVGSLLRSSVMLATVVGVIAIWTEITPALRMFERVEIWPEIAWRAPERDSLEIFAEQLEPVESGEATTPAEASGQSSVTGPLALAQRAESPSDGTFPITLWVLGKALIIGLLTIVRVRDLPGVLDLSLLRRTRLDPGARIAVLTLSRYIFTFMGSAYVFRTLGISWAKCSVARLCHDIRSRFRSARDSWEFRVGDHPSR